MAIRKRTIASLLLAITALLILGQAVQAGHESSVIDWDETKLYWPDQEGPQYWIYSSSVQITDLRPGETLRPYRLTIGNELERPQTFKLTLLGLADGSSETVPEADWIKFTRDSDPESDPLPSGLVTVAGKARGVPGEATVWIHLAVPRHKKHLEQMWQYKVHVGRLGESQAEGLTSVVTVFTAEALASKGRSGLTTAWVLLGIAVVAGTAVYTYSRRRWPPTPKEEEVARQVEDDKEQGPKDKATTHRHSSTIVGPTHWR